MLVICCARIYIAFTTHYATHLHLNSRLETRVSGVSQVGTSRSASISSLTNGRTYRFYAVAVNDVGAGERTAVFAAEMRCTPRTLVAAPYKDATGRMWVVEHVELRGNTKEETEKRKKE